MEWQTFWQVAILMAWATVLVMVVLGGLKEKK